MYSRLGYCVKTTTRQVSESIYERIRGLYSLNFYYFSFDLDTFVEDFLMTYIVFLPVQKLCPILVTYYQILDNNKDFPNESSIANKRRVVAFVKEWCDIAKDAFYEEPTISQLLQVVHYGF